jgi:adenine-specific DNA-methyltransferase
LPIQLLDHADALRREMAEGLARKRKSALGQFMTPSPVARFMASLFPASTQATCQLLDAGAGVGALTCAFLDRWTGGEGLQFRSVEVHAYEIDDIFREHLKQTLAVYADKLPVTYQVIPGDFIWEAACKCFLGVRPFSHAILNPPYKKINSDSQHRSILRRARIETVNLYSAFVALSLTLMAPSGHLVAIIPRSFCNGPYYRPFRQFLLGRAAIRHMHLFASRAKAFKDDDVLQENIIIALERGGTQSDVTISTSTDASFNDLTTNKHPFGRIVFPGDPETFIHVPTSLDRNAVEHSSSIRFTLDDLGIGVSTGPVVDFRLQEHIQQRPGLDTVPLLYPGHFAGHAMQWPREGMKRGNAIKLNAETRKWLYPNGFYAVVRRFSAKEERRRIVANVVTPGAFSDAPMIGFENHLNLFHEKKRGLPENLAHGLAAFLNTTAVDQHFRGFNGHTQVNAMDLRLMRYPSREALIALGKWARSQAKLTQAILDERLQRLCE